MDQVIQKTRARIERYGRLHWFHWLAVVLSLFLTLGVYLTVRGQELDRADQMFQRESSRVLELIQERMQKYEDALWAGVAMHNAVGSELELQDWIDYTESIKIEKKYPGINGIGVIYSVDRDELPGFLGHQREQRPDFQVFPEHDREELFPIVYIEPSGLNHAAIGLDIAHEQNRYAGAVRARETGQAQITGPIVLVQDDEKTPGFLFYAPFYAPIAESEKSETQSPAGVGEFQGMIYAPFVVKKLMEGALRKETRHIGIRLSDGESVLYDELTPEEPDIDPDPMFSHTTTLMMYGQPWTISVQSSSSFRAINQSSKPLLILACGLLIDSLLLYIFINFAHLNRKTIWFADRVGGELVRKNAELEEFVRTASHDLKSPLCTIQGFAGLLGESVRAGDYSEIEEFVDYIDRGINRMQSNIDDLLSLSRAGQTPSERVAVDPSEIARTLIDDIANQIQNSGADVYIQPDMPAVLCYSSRFSQALENLVINATKYAAVDGQRLEIRIVAVAHRDMVKICVIDNGPGIASEQHERVFSLFERLVVGGEGSGVGLAIVKRICEVHGGTAGVESAPGSGAAFFMLLPKACKQKLAA